MIYTISLSFQIIHQRPYRERTTSSQGTYVDRWRVRQSVEELKFQIAKESGNNPKTKTFCQKFRESFENIPFLPSQMNSYGKNKIIFGFPTVFSICQPSLRVI